MRTDNALLHEARIMDAERTNDERNQLRMALWRVRWFNRFGYYPVRILPRRWRRVGRVQS